MIKTYDEALKTMSNVRNYLAINRADDCVEELDKVARYFINEKYKEKPTFSECIKEWEEKGWKVVKNPHELLCCKNNYCVCYPIGEREFNHYYLIDENYCTFDIDYDLSVLITKTLKALEVSKDE